MQLLLKIGVGLKSVCQFSIVLSISGHFNFSDCLPVWCYYNNFLNLRQFRSFPGLFLSEYYTFDLCKILIKMSFAVNQSSLFVLFIGLRFLLNRKTVPKLCNVKKKTLHVNRSYI